MLDPVDPVTDARTPARQIARASIVAPMAALLVSFIAGQLRGDGNGPIAEQINLIAGVVTSLLILSGVGLGVAGILAGLRRRSHDTTLIAGLGLFLSGGYLLVTIWVIGFLYG